MEDKKVVGVRWNRKSQRWIANIRVMGSLIHLGSFKTKDDAISARNLANLKYDRDDLRYKSDDGLSQDRLKYLLNYDPTSGVFTRLKYSKQTSDIVGCDDGRGYLFTEIDGKIYRLHRLAFLYMEGVFPEQAVDHIDHNKRNNRWDNLRKVKPIENSRNQPISSSNKSGHIGVSKVQSLNKWYASIMVEGRSINLGTFDDINDAISARESASIKYGFHKNHGRDCLGDS